MADENATILSGSARSRRLLLLLFNIFLHVVASSSKSDAEILIKFKAFLKINNGALSNWDPTKPPCNGDKENWDGVLCHNGILWGLKLENMGLGGVIDIDTLSELTNLRAISLMNNNFDGSLPNLTKLGTLKTIYLSNNKFSGEIPEHLFDATLSLKKIHLSQNKFSGQIPVSLTILPKLMELMLEDNQFEGLIPEFHQDRLKWFNVSNNQLEGEIPSSLSHINATAFYGNKDLCGAPLESCPSPAKLSVGSIIIVSVLVATAIAALIAVVVILSRRKQTLGQEEATASPGQRKVTTAADLDKMEQGSSSPENSTHSKKSDQNVKLTFLKDDRGHFDMTDLLKSSAEILGSGVFGSSYKAALNADQVMVVKRFKHMNNVGKTEFHEHMRRLGRLSHQNLLPVVAYYYRKEEKLLVFDYVDNFSLAFHLHGDRTRGHPHLDWAARLKIIKGVSKGLLYLHNELPSLMAPHGHLKSSNVLLDKSYNPLLTDYALIPVVNQEHAQEQMIAYKSPEYKQSRRIMRKTDVWSLGILILEILTGIIPSNFLQQGKENDTDLVTWVKSLLAGDDSSNNNVAKVFDKDIGGSRNSEGEMMKLLKIGLNCCEGDLDTRWDIKEVVDKIEEIKEKDTDDDFYSSYTSEGDMRSSRGLSDDFLFNNTG
ncbi:Pollen receptor-like kinase 1 [Forsythia ovata]|uniref:non-specific serine/threonine protein kinase n=1 Tax=Forsythia ovata TaxID=205694 RepID=A0ABD1SRH0_9LAMI